MKAQEFKHEGRGMPYPTAESIDEYIANRRPPGGFLHAVLSNNLMESFKRADEHNQAGLVTIVAYLYYHAPSDCWGSLKKVEAWLKGANGQRPEEGENP
jgi:hypothetical protein